MSDKTQARSEQFKVNRIVKTAFLTFIIITLTSCAFGTIEDMLSPPRMTEEQTAIYKALTDSKGMGFKLKYPRMGEYRSAFVLYNDNLNAQADSAIVFYEISGINTERSLWMNFLYKSNEGKWEALYDLPIINGIDIESISFERFGEDEKNNIIVSYLMGHNEKRYMIITDENNIPITQHDNSYSFMQIDKFFDREYKELLVLKNDRASASAAAVFYNYRDGQLYISASCELDPTSGEYTDIILGNAAENVPAIFINHKKHDSAESYGTDVLYYRGNNLINPVTEHLENSDKTLRRTSIVTELANPRDIDGDGIIELAGSAGEFPGYDSLPHLEKLRPVIWRRLNINDGRFEDLYYSFYTEKYDYVLFLPTRWINQITAAVTPDEGIISFFDEEGNILLTVNAVEKDEDYKPDEGFTLFKQGKTNGFKYYMKSADPADTPAMTTGEIEYAFRVLSEINQEE